MEELQKTPPELIKRMPGHLLKLGRQKNRKGSGGIKNPLWILHIGPSGNPFSQCPPEG